MQKFVPLKYYTLSSQLRRLTSFSVGLFGSANSVTRSYPVMRKSYILTCSIDSLTVTIAVLGRNGSDCNQVPCQWPNTETRRYWRYPGPDVYNFPKERVFMCKPILQVIILATAMLVSSFHSLVLENTTKCPRTFHLFFKPSPCPFNLCFLQN